MDKVALIVAVIKQSTSFSCNHVTFEVKGDYVFVRGTNEKGIFHATDLIGVLDSLCSCFLDIEEGRVILKCF